MEWKSIKMYAIERNQYTNHLSVDVYVTNGTEFGIGNYNFISNKWNCIMFDDENYDDRTDITHFMYPISPKR